MFFDLNVPVPEYSIAGQNISKKGKGKQQQLPASSSPAPSVLFSAAQITVLDARVDLLVHLGYSVIAFTQTAQKRVDPKTHVNVLDGLLGKLRKREGILFLKRLNIVLDDDSEKGFGLINANTSIFTPYDLISLVPTTPNTLSLACLTHTMPTPLTAHIIALPLTLPRLPFYLKHTLIRTALKNGAVFEIGYAGALGGEQDVGVAKGQGGAGAKKNWWAAAREVVRVTKGKGVLVSGGVMDDADLRAPRDVANMIAILGLSHDAAYDSMSRVPKSLVIRAQTRKTYRTVLSEPKLIIPISENKSMDADLTPNLSDVAAIIDPPTLNVVGLPHASSESLLPSLTPTPTPTPTTTIPQKRVIEVAQTTPRDDGEKRKKKKRKKD